MQGKALVLQLYDMEKFFDKERMEDAMLTCYARGADPKAIRCWYKLNEETVIRVKTGAGLSEAGMVGAVIGQGTIGGALVSQAVLDEAMKEHFQPGGKEELFYGNVELAPLLFQDDFIYGANDLEKANKTNKKINIMIKERGLSLNQKKSVCLIIGPKRKKESMSEELKENPLKCGEVEKKPAPSKLVHITFWQKCKNCR